MHKTIRVLQIIVLLALLPAYTPYIALSATYQLNISGNRMIADFENMPLTAVVNDIGLKTGIRFIFLGGGSASDYSRPFSLRMDSTPLRTAIEKLLSNFNYSLISDGNDNIRQVFIMGAKSTAGTGAKTRTPFVMAEVKQTTLGEGMPIRPGEGMQITPGEGMQITPGEGMQIGPGDGMQITPGEGMQITPGEGMVIGPSGTEERNTGFPNTETMGNRPSGSQKTNTGTVVRKTGRSVFKIRK